MNFAYTNLNCSHWCLFPLMMYLLSNGLYIVAPYVMCISVCRILPRLVEDLADGSID